MFDNPNLFRPESSDRTDSNGFNKIGGVRLKLISASVSQADRNKADTAVAVIQLAMLQASAHAEVWILW